MPPWIGFITGFDAADGGGDAVGEINRPFWPHAVTIGKTMQTAAIAATALDLWRCPIKLNWLLVIDRF